MGRCMKKVENHWPTQAELEVTQTKKLCHWIFFLWSQNCYRQ